MSHKRNIKFVGGGAIERIRGGRLEDGVSGGGSPQGRGGKGYC